MWVRVWVRGCAFVAACACRFTVCISTESFSVVPVCVLALDFVRCVLACVLACLGTLLFAGNAVGVTRYQSEWWVTL